MSGCDFNSAHAWRHVTSVVFETLNTWLDIFALLVFNQPSTVKVFFGETPPQLTAHYARLTKNNIFEITALRKKMSENYSSSSQQQSKIVRLLECTQSARRRPQDGDSSSARQNLGNSKALSQLLLAFRHWRHTSQRSSPHQHSPPFPHKYFDTQLSQATYFRHEWLVSIIFMSYISSILCLHMAEKWVPPAAGTINHLPFNYLIIFFHWVSLKI